MPANEAASVVLPTIDGEEDEQFHEYSDEAMKSGEEMINDLSESQLISLIKDKNFPAIQLWLNSIIRSTATNWK